MNKLIKRLLELPIRMFMIAKYEYLGLFNCPNCGEELVMTIDDIRLMMRITKSLTIPCIQNTCRYCEQEFEFDRNVFIEHTFQNKALRQALYGHYLEWMPTDLVNEFQVYCDEHPDYDFKNPHSIDK